ncbi:hypothetical protein TraAM80_07953 [Trypanosoma rangeli]|uniref:Uncharacterized protein n=1 Tax=Trypanosoma rangeli TaxID=5698 RepID=A0A3R7LMD8_TRYRA|nr:uncharacterized protein TraAM80_07953 [Trypanosoma rangeli]RNE99828.1 hypothetical protein TraAM80_07953 [Trypanosoma rangeli]|eukprot:RNE99828.1 hypothetical protein TraAM80_07953 [Trypanosoma rangeli]
MDVLPSHLGDWAVESDPDVPFPAPRVSMGLSRIRRAFFKDLMGSIESDESQSPDVVVSPSSSWGRSSQKGCSLSDAAVGENKDDDNNSSNKDNSDVTCGSDSNTGAVDVEVLPVSSTSRKRVMRRYSAIAVSALGGAILAGFVRRGISTIFRTLVSGLLLTQLLSSLGYAEVYWKRIMEDLWGVCAYTPESRPLRAAIAMIAGSVERKIAIVCGIVVGLFLS